MEGGDNVEWFKDYIDYEKLNRFTRDSPHKKEALTLPSHRLPGLNPKFNSVA